MASFKILHQGELRRLTLNTTNTDTDTTKSWAALKQRISELVSLSPESFTVKYTDDDGDLITLSTDHELADLLALQQQQQQQQQQKSASFRLQIFPIAPTTSAAALATATSPAREKPVNEDDEEEAGSTANAEEKGKAKSTNSDSDSDSESKTKPQPPSLEDILKRIQGVNQRIEEVFAQHPEISQELEDIAEQFVGFFEHRLREHHQHQQEQRKRRHEFFAAQCHAFFGGGGGCGGQGGTCHPQHCQSKQQQQQQQQQVPPRPQFFARTPETPFESEPTAGRFGGRGFQHPFARIFEEKLAALESMGFIDRDLNVALLKKHRGDVEGVVQELFGIYERFE